MIESEAHLKDQDGALFRGGNVVPVSARLPLPSRLGIKSKNIGKRGGGKRDGEGRTKGLLIKELVERLSKYSIRPRYAIIAGLMNLVGFPEVTRQLVRGIFLKGCT